MRTVCFILVSLLGLTGCSSAQPTPHREDAYARHAAHAHYTWARSLQHVIMQRPAHELLDEPGQELVLELARAQTCLTSRTHDPVLAAQTQSMLDAYLALYEEHGDEPPSSLRRKVRRAQRDAEVAGQGVASPYFLGCEPFHTPRSRGPRREYIHRDTKGARPYMFQGRHVPGGVIE